MLSWHHPVILPSDAGQYRSAARVHAASGSFAHPEVHRPAGVSASGERDILRRYNATPGNRQSGAWFKPHIFSGLQKSGTSGQKQRNTFICGAAIKRCYRTAGQSFNPQRSVPVHQKKYIRFEHQFGMGILLSHAASIRRAAPVTERPHTSDCGSGSRSAWRRNHET